MNNSNQDYNLPINAAAEIAKATISILDADDLLETAVELIYERFGFYYVGIYVVEENGKLAILRSHKGRVNKKDMSIEINNDTIIGTCIINGKIDVADTNTKHAEAVLPLIGRDAVMGALHIKSKTTDYPTKETEILQTITEQLAIAIENAYLFDALSSSQQVAEDLLHETIALQQLSQALSATLNVDEIVEIFFQTCTKMLGFDFVIFSLVDFKQKRVKAVSGAGVPHYYIEQADYALDSNNIMADIVRTGHTEIITGWDERLDKEIFDDESLSDWKLKIFTPIRLRQENIGVIEIGYNKAFQGEVQDSQVRLLRAFIDQTALALDNAKRYEASQQAIHREELIKNITTKVRDSNNLDTILQTAVKEIGDALHGKRTYIYLISPTNGHNS